MLPFVHVPCKQFCKQLAARREHAVRIDWENSEARAILIKDLQEGLLSLGDQKRSAQDQSEHLVHLRLA